MSYDRNIEIGPPSRFLEFRLRELWEARELVYFFVWRDIKVRYKQTVLGVLWTVLRPLVSMAIFTFVFSTLGGFPSGGVPYPLLALSGVLVWTVVSEGITGATQSLLNNPNLVTKVYFPRMVVPLASVCRPMLDCLVAGVVYAAAAVYYAHAPTWNLLLLLPALLFAACATLGVGLWFCAVSVRYRDIALGLPWVLQLLFWISPVGYSSAQVPAGLAWAYWLNPFTGVIEAFRHALLGAAHLPLPLLIESAAVNAAILLSGVWYFQRTEREFADVI